MASTNNKQMNVKNENNPKINTTALKKEKVKKNTKAQALQTERVFNIIQNRAGKSVPLLSVSQLPEDNKDSESVKFRFGWVKVENCFMPFIVRNINGEPLKFVSTRIAEIVLLGRYLNDLHPEIHNCASINSHYMTDAEAILFNNIILNHSNQAFGNENFQASKDYIVRLDDVKEFYTFLDVCSKKLKCKNTTEHREMGGFICINSQINVPYSVIGEKKYLPFFYFEGDIVSLSHYTVKLEKWSLAYLKFTFLVHNLKKELIPNDSCRVISLEDVMRNFHPGTSFVEKWVQIDTKCLVNLNTSYRNVQAAWFRAPLGSPNKNPATNSILPTTWPIAKLPVIPTPRIQVSAQPVTPQPNLLLINNTYGNKQSSNQMGSVILQQSNNTFNSLPTPPTNDTATSVVSNYVASFPVHVNSRKRNASRNAAADILPSVTIDLTLKSIVRIIKYSRANKQPKIPYIMKRKVVYRKIFHFINAEPFIYSNQMVTLHELVKTLLPGCTVSKCASVLQNHSETTLYRANSEQLAILREFIDIDVKNTPMVMERDIDQVLLQIKEFMAEQVECVQTHQPAGKQAKRRCIN